MLPNLPRGMYFPAMVIHNETILLSGGMKNPKTCFQLEKGSWINHSTFSEERFASATVTTNKGTFIFGGIDSTYTYEYLLNDSTEWQKGKVLIPNGFSNGCAIAVKSGQEIWLIGGYFNERRILSFNVKDHSFEEIPMKLNVKRAVGHNCAFIPNTNKIIVTGGVHKANDDASHRFLWLDSTEVIDIEQGKVVMARRMVSKRADHGIGLITIKDEEKLAVFGGQLENGFTLDSVEVLNAQTQKWEISNMRLKEGKRRFGYLTTKLRNIVPLSEL